MMMSCMTKFDKDKPGNSPGGGTDPALLERLVALTPDIIYVHDVVADRNVYANPRACEFTGLTQAEMAALGPGLLPSIIHPDDLAEMRAQRLADGRLSAWPDRMVEARYRLRAADGSWHWIRTKERPFQWDADGHVTQVMGIITEIGALVAAEQGQAQQAEALESERADALHRRGLLLRELNHRIKNSLQLVVSLLRLQAGTLGAGDTRVAFDAACQRVSAIAEIHARLYMTEEVGLLDFGDYVRTLAPQLASLSGRPEVVVLVEEAAGRLDVDRAVPIGLILNELLSNALRHAYPAGTRGTVRVGFRADEGAAWLWVADDGPGPAQPLRHGLGLRLSKALAEQVRGTLVPTMGKGLRWDLKVPLG